tara:strand:- start:626 stop:967 length:342 start_codon:yes stop_codon:yes gene_type:complete
MRLCKNGKLRGSTEVVLFETLPRILLDDSLNMPDKLNFTPDMISKKMVEKAKLYLANMKTHIFEGAAGRRHYVLRFKSAFPKLTKKLCKDYMDTLNGKEPTRVSMHDNAHACM